MQGTARCSRSLLNDALHMDVRFVAVSNGCHAQKTYQKDRRPESDQLSFPIILLLYMQNLKQ